MFLIPANTKLSILIFGIFKPFDLILFGSGSFSDIKDANGNRIETISDGKVFDKVSKSVKGTKTNIEYSDEYKKAHANRDAARKK